MGPQKRKCNFGEEEVGCGNNRRLYMKVVTFERDVKKSNTFQFRR